jgi:hypothetical protein
MLPPPPKILLRAVSLAATPASALSSLAHVASTPSSSPLHRGGSHRPSSLSHASLVCKRWRLLSNPFFVGRFYVHHRAPPLLSFFTDHSADAPPGRRRVAAGHIRCFSHLINS